MDGWIDRYIHTYIDTYIDRYIYIFVDRNLDTNLFSVDSYSVKGHWGPCALLEWAACLGLFFNIS